MTITLVLPQPPGYSETFFRSKIKGLQESGYEVILVTAATNQVFKGCQHLQHPKVYKNPVLQVFNMSIVFLGLLLHLKSVLRYINLEQSEGTRWKRIIEKLYINATLLKLKTDWMHFGFATMALDRELVAKAIGAQLAVSLRGYDIEVYPLKHKNCYSLLWKEVDKVHSISNYLLQKAYISGLSSEVKHQIITPAVDFDRLRSLSKHQAENSEKLKLLTIARLHWIKGIDDLIKAASFLKEQNIDFEWKLIGGGDLKHTERFKYHVYQSQLEEHIKFLGKQTHEDTLTNLREADIYVQPSLSEGFCNSVLEAQALGKLCIVSDAEGLSENILDKQTGWVVHRCQPKVLAKQIIKTINLSTAKKLDIQKAAIQRVKNHFGLEQQQEKFSEFY
jgi:colanic acid/amylovoran biosynthesis glycosyltransferase